jgi:hypothetical protein
VRAGSYAQYPKIKRHLQVVSGDGMLGLTHVLLTSSYFVLSIHSPSYSVDLVSRCCVAAPRSAGSGGTNNLPPILFHQVHGDNIRISRDGTVARRAESFCKGVTFSSRPVKVAEKVSCR